jgi:hypothetical protein
VSKKTWIKIKRGLLDPKHRERLGVRIWLYLHILDRANWDQGAVLEWRDEGEAKVLEMDLSTLRIQRRQLEADGYIRCERRGHSQRLIVLKWVNPREYTGRVYNPPDVAGMTKRPSVENLTLEDGLAVASEGPSDNQSDRSSDNQSVQLPTLGVLKYLRPHTITPHTITGHEDDDDGAAERFALVVRAWETTSGPITAGIAEDLGDLVGETDIHRLKLPPGAAGAGLSGEEWLCAAIQEARVSSDGRRPNVKFIQRILERWMVDGFKAARRPGGGSRPATGPDAIDAWAERKSRRTPAEGVKHGND